MPPDDSDDRKAKDVLADELDPASRADLERWFGLPSYQELEDKGQPAEDPDIVAVRERRQKAIAAVDPAMLEAHRRRTEPPDDLIRFSPDIELRIDPSIARLDMAMVERQAAVADPREVEISDELRDDLRDCTPQAILRDLHRPEIDFDKTFEMVDMAADQRLDIVAEVETVMTTRWQLAPEDLIGSPFGEACQVMATLRAEQRQPWAALFAANPLPNRRWSPEEDR